MRVLFNGRIPAFQAGCVGSIPITRSKEKDKFRQKLVFFSYIRLAASYIASQWYLSYDKLYSLREFWRRI